MVFGVLIGAFSLGQAAPNLEGLLTAAGVSVAIFDIIDRVCKLGFVYLSGYIDRVGR